MHLRRRHGDDGFSSGGARFTPPSSNAPTTAFITTCALQDLPVIFCMDRAGLSAERRPDASRLVRHRLSALRAERHRHGAEGRGRTGGHDVHRHARKSSDVHPLSARRGGRRADQGPAASCSKSARRKSSRIFRNNGKRKVALFGLGNMNHHGAQGGAATCARKASMCAVINPRFTKPIDAGTHGIFRPRGGCGRDAGRPCAAWAATAQRVLELFSEKQVTTPVVRIGWPDQFIEHASTRDDICARSTA